MRYVFATLLFVFSAHADGHDVNPLEIPNLKSDVISGAELHKYQFCQVDNQCVYTRNGCCDCANGGQDVAVNKDKLEEFKKNFDCKKAKCTKRKGHCGSGTVKCIQYRCNYIEEKK